MKKMITLSIGIILIFLSGCKNSNTVEGKFIDEQVEGLA